MKYPKHLLQSEEWAKFKSSWGTPAYRVGETQFTVHGVGFSLPWKIGFAPRVGLKDLNLKQLQEKGRNLGCVFIKVEPNSNGPLSKVSGVNLMPSESLLGSATFLLDLTQQPDQILSNMRKTTRYNIRLAERKGVQVKVGSDKKMQEELISLQKESGRRGGFLVHPDSYYRLFFKIFSEQKMLHLVNAYYQKRCLASQVFVNYQGTLFYLYAGTADSHKEVMAAYAAMWKGIQLGQELGCKTLDFWSALSSEEEKTNHPWYGFHYFKQGFGGELVSFSGAYDLVINQLVYPLLILGNKLRWVLLRLSR